MNTERAGGGDDRSLEERIANEVRREAEGRSDDYVHANYEDAADLMRSAANRYDELYSQDQKSERQNREIEKVGAELREREAAWKAWSNLAEERNVASDLAEDRRLEALERNRDMGEAPQQPQDRQLAERSVVNMADSNERSGFWSSLVDRLRGGQERGPAPPPTREAANLTEPPKPPPPPVARPALEPYVPSNRELPKPPEGFRKPSGAALDMAIEAVSARAGIDPAEAKGVARSFSGADWNWHFADSSNERSRGRESVEKAIADMKDFAGKSRAHAELASSIADNRYYDLARVGQWYVKRDERDPALVRELVDQKLLHSFDSSRASSDTPKGAERRDPDREVARGFRQLSQAERLQDSRMNAGAKAVAAIDAAIERKYGAATPEADKMKRAAREAVAQTLESGEGIRAPRLRATEKEVELRRDDRQRTADAADRTAKDLER